MAAPGDEEFRSFVTPSGENYGIPAEQIYSWNEREAKTLPIMLTPADEGKQTGPNFVGTLLPYQQVVLYAMLRLELNPRRDYKCTKDCPGFDTDAASDCNCYVATSAARLSLPPGSGKTVLMAALYAETGASAPTQPNVYAKGVRFEPVECLDMMVVFAVANVITQWKENLTRFVKMPEEDIGIIDNVFSLRKFKKMFDDLHSGAYKSKSKTKQTFAKMPKILLIKSGRVVDNECGDKSLMLAFAEAIGPRAVGRLVLDDPSLIRLSHDDIMVPARFTWYVDATNWVNAKRFKRHKCSEICHRDLSLIYDLSTSAEVNNQFNINVSPDMIQAASDMTVVEYTALRVAGGVVAHLVGAVAGVDVEELLNGGAFEAAAQKLDLNVSTSEELLRRVVGGALEDVKRAHNVERRIEALRGCVHEGPSSSNAVQLGEMVWNLPDDQFAMLVAATSISTDTYDNTVKRLTERAKKALRAIERLAENAREGDCQCCQVPKEASEPVYIFLCCQVVCCEICSVLNAIETKSHARTGRATTVQYVDKCPNCRASVSAGGSLSVVRLDTAEMLVGMTSQETIDATAENIALPFGTYAEAGAASSEASAASSEAGAADINGTDPKVRALLRYLASPKVAVDGKVVLGIDTPPPVGGIMTGVRSVQRPPEAPRRVLVYARTNESMLKITAALTASSVPFEMLRGTRAAKGKTCEKFRNSTSPLHVMLVATPENCGGLHMPYVTDIVLFHRMQNEAAETQVIGRGQRMGREYNLSVCYLLYEHE